MKIIASATNKATALVLAKIYEGVQNVIIGQLSRVKSLKKVIQNARKVCCDVPLINTNDRALTEPLLLFTQVGCKTVSS